LNIYPISLTLDTSQEDKAALKTVSWSIARIFVTLDTFHEEIFILNAEAKENINDISVTLDTSQEDTSPLKVEAL
jgi:hypothetical protein